MSQCGTNAGFAAHKYRGETPCEPCRAANNLYENKRIVERARTGQPRTINPQPLGAALRAATEAGISLLSVTARCDLSHPTLWRIQHDRNRYIYRTTAHRIEKALRAIIAERQEHQNDCLDHLDYLHQTNPSHAAATPRPWPARPLLDAVIARYGDLMKSGHARQLHRLNQKGWLTDDQADEWAHKLLDTHPADIWPDWGLGETA